MTHFTPKETIITAAAFLTILLTTYSFAYAQTPTPPEVVVREIQSYARRHAQNNSLQTQLVVDLYRDNDSGLTPQEIANIYEEEYVKEKGTLQPSPWARFRPNSGWIVAGILFILFILRDVIKDALANLLERVWDRIYGKLGGSLILRPLALQKYRKRILERYQELRVPFRSNLPLSMNEMYIPLKLEVDKDVSSYEGRKLIENNKRLLVTGSPGSGKTMLLRSILLDYAKGTLHLPERPMPVLIELQRLGNPESSIEDEIASELARTDFPDADDFVIQSLKQGNLMLLLDGLDEVSSTERPRVILSIKDFLNKYDHCRVIITCRPAVYHGELTSEIDSEAKTVEFSDLQIRHFLSKWVPDKVASRSIDQLMRILQERSRIMLLARNPMLTPLKEL